MIVIRYREDIKTDKLNIVFTKYKQKVERVKSEFEDLIKTGDSEILINLSDSLPLFYFVCSQKNTDRAAFNDLMSRLQNAMTETVDEIGEKNILNFYFS